MLMHCVVRDKVLAVSLVRLLTIIFVMMFFVRVYR